jgi:S1-C subfamily serine protease
MLPPVSLPSATSQKPAATAAALPELLPPGISSRATGFFVAPNIIATNYHVMEGATNASCYLNNSDKEYKIDGYVGIDKTVDLILLKVSTLNKPVIKLAVTTASIVQKVYVIGSPRGLPATISDGIISGMRDFEGTKLLQMTSNNKDLETAGFNVFLVQLQNNPIESKRFLPSL